MTDTKFARDVIKRITYYLPSKRKGRTTDYWGAIEVSESVLEDAKTCIEDCIARIVLLEAYHVELKRKAECFLKDSSALIDRILTDPSYAEKCAKILRKEGGAK